MAFASLASSVVQHYGNPVSIVSQSLPQLSLTPNGGGWDLEEASLDEDEDGV
eukprot:CAMPEP_0172446394 /NCGR_PEP_ID=MMETSP1065-20121228/6004_1 /TAXON_ID=265537 /ORGANISM="Amphiprora paludosa, Strain CCMP125" /LENGTH=51 /DNA_ID=CAMNT_0013197505 /DNA_START=175 /DNA_END=330 /DNA_ORIENTATION=-